MLKTRQTETLQMHQGNIYPIQQPLSVLLSDLVYGRRPFGCPPLATPHRGQ